MPDHYFDKGPYIMGILNVTPDSFSDGGRFIDPARAEEHALRMIAEGADIVDIGGESTRPGAAPVLPQEEMDRVLPVIERLKGCGTLLSVDTRHAATMKAAVAAGAGMINDITALEGDPDSVRVAAQTGIPVCLMHMQGTPQTMQDNPAYVNPVQEICDFLLRRIDFCEKNGVLKQNIIVDPGIGFGKRLTHNLDIIRNVSYFAKTGVPVLIGASRKRFIEELFPDAGKHHRTPGSVAVALWCLQQGASLFRVHDVAETKQAFAVFNAIRNSFDVRSASL
jgi:dihydropteroate synthase